MWHGVSLRFWFSFPNCSALFHVLICHLHIFSLEKCLFHPSLFKLGCLSFIVELQEFYVYRTLLCVVCKRFIPFYGLSSYSLTVSLEAQVFNVDKVPVIFSFVACAVFVSYLRNLCLRSGSSQRLSLMFSSRSFMVLAFTFGSPTHLEFIHFYI